MKTIILQYRRQAKKKNPASKNSDKVTVKNKPLVSIITPYNIVQKGD